MTYQHTGLPPKQGLYDPQFEHDACGIGCVVNINGAKTHLIIKQALTILANLAHRGGAGSEDNTGDGAGILVQIPDKFFRKMCPSNEITLPGPGDYGVGMVFLPRGVDHRMASEAVIENAVRAEGQHILGWRTVPINESTLGSIARSNRPYIRQIFIGKGSPSMTPSWILSESSMESASGVRK